MSEPLRLPEGYSLEFDSNHNLVSKRRADSTRVVAFEVSAFGPDPDRIMQIAADDAEWIQQDAGRREHGHRQAEQRSLMLLSEGLDLGTDGEIFVSREELHERGL